MRKILLSSVFLFGFIIKGHCFYTSIQQTRLWQSSYTASYNSGTRIASGTVILHAVIVETNGTSSAIELFNGNTSSNTATIFSSIDSTAYRDPMYDVVFSSGLIYNNIGTTAARVKILWDWFIMPGQTP